MQIQFITTDILLVDVIGFSKLSTEDQFKTVYLLSAEIKNLLKIMLGQAFRKEQEVILGFVPTGDGFYLLLHPAIAGYGVLLALSLRTCILHVQKRSNSLFAGIRVAVHLGEAVPFTDIAGHPNFVGDGMNVCARLLGANERQSPTHGLPVDTNFVIASSAALEYFEHTFISSDTRRSFLDVIKYSKSEMFSITDKHDIEHQAHFVEASRHAAINPPWPDNLHERLEQLNDIYKNI